MTNASHVTALNVFLNHVSQRHLVGRCALTHTGKIAFEYSSEWLTKGVELSPYAHPLSNETYLGKTGVNDPRLGLPGFLADALPDHWGTQVMEQALASQGIFQANALDRLAWQANRAVGAFEFEPCLDASNTEPNSSTLRQLQIEAQQILDGQISELLPLLSAAGSAGGAYPKYAVYLNDQGHAVYGEKACAEGYRPVILKVPTQNQPYQPIEHSYAQMVKLAGINVPGTSLLWSENQPYYAIDRFDRSGKEATTKHHQQTLAGLLDRNFQTEPTSAEDALGVCLDLTGDHRQVVELFRRIVFNYLGHNCDDHAKNFSFQLDENFNWRLSPWYDGGWCNSATGHSMSIGGQRFATGRWLYKQLADEFAIRNVEEIIDSVVAALGEWPQLAAANKVPKAQIDKISQLVAVNITALGK